MSHTSREANLLGACSLAIAGRLPAAAQDAALVALNGWLAGTTVDGLARVLHLTHSGAVRLADRLERDGLITREACADDARGSFAVITDEGRRRLAAARVTHLGGVRRHFLSQLTAEEQDRLGDTWERVVPGIT
jgi:DNA-binding MarR family transcriptional regulator